MLQLNLKFDTAVVSKERFWTLPHDILNPETDAFKVVVSEYLDDSRIVLQQNGRMVATLYLEPK